MTNYWCHLCGLHFFIGGAEGLVCAECGTQHRLKGTDCLVFGTGPEFRKVSLEDQARYLQRAAEKKLRNAQRAEEAQERAATRRKD